MLKCIVGVIGCIVLLINKVQFWIWVVQNWERVKPKPNIFAKIILIIINIFLVIIGIYSSSILGGIVLALWFDLCVAYIAVDSNIADVLRNEEEEVAFVRARGGTFGFPSVSIIRVIVFSIVTLSLLGAIGDLILWIFQG